ncbi:MAG: transglycosylase domain-containing protein [Deltaproteobacteria bacterium]|jgi:penicillin-binding protein 1A|nr:transglycosylase domain-containing protein [Deltaproteobacteria bacterium]
MVVINKRKSGFIKSALSYYFFIFLMIIILAGLAGAFIFGFYARDVTKNPDFDSLKNSASISTQIFATDGTILAEVSGMEREWETLKKIPKQLQNAFIATEDARYFEHGALDLVGLIRAIMINMKAGMIKQGGSTITQQVAKFYMGGERTFDRKIREMILALRFERNLSKQEILELYLNLIYLGRGAYGVKAAARKYFDSTLKDLDLGQMALLAGLAQAPSRYSPYYYQQIAVKRRETVLHSMHQRGYISKDDMEKANNSPLQVVSGKDYYNDRTPYFTEHVRRKLIGKIGREAFKKGGYQVQTTVRPYVQYLARKNVEEMARWQDKRQGWRGPEKKLEKEEVIEFIKKSRSIYGKKGLLPETDYLGVVTSVSSGETEVRAGDYHCIIPLRHLDWATPFDKTTGVNDKKLADARQALSKGDVVFFRIVKKTSEVKSYTCKLEQIPRVQSSIYARDNDSGYVVAMVGGTDFDLSSYNRTVQACRQPGSTYKPFYYSLALDKGWSIKKKFSDIPYSIIDPATGQRWRVRNYQYEKQFDEKTVQKIKEHKITLQRSLIWSRNIPSVTIFQALGARRVTRWIKRFGFTTRIIPDKGLALGASCVKIDEITTAFSVFANNGKLIKPVAVKRILNSSGKVVVDNSHPKDPTLNSFDRIKRMIHQLEEPAPQAIPAKTAWQTSKLLRQVVTRGHNGAIRKTKLKVAGKTGTASKTMDTWFSGYSAHWSITAWLGDEKYERQLGYDDAAHMTTAVLFARFMYDAARYYPQRELPLRSYKSGEYQDETPEFVYKKSKKPEYKPPNKDVLFKENETPDKSSDAQ